jgi:hypothetical protein
MRYPVADRHALIKRTIPALLVLSSVLLGIATVEGLCRWFFPLAASGSDKARHGIIFVDGPDNIFRNQGEIFTYVPHGDMRNVTGFFDGDRFDIEYDYHFRTNNLGLVQEADVVPGRQSVLLLGDSFTEGQGAEPWFRLIAPEIERRGYQAVNGGLLATGFEQWLKLDRHLTANNIRIQKIVVVFISLDYIRPVFNFGENDFRCFAGSSLCRAEESFSFRLPPPGELTTWVDKIRAARSPLMAKSWFETHAEALLPASYHVYEFAKQRLKNPTSIGRSRRAGQASRAAIAELIGIYGAENVTFIHLPQKDELADKLPIGPGLEARRSIREYGGKLFDGFELCGLTTADYYPNDEHPNRGGYSKIAACVLNIIKEQIAVPQ